MSLRYSWIPESTEDATSEWERFDLHLQALAQTPGIMISERSQHVPELVAVQFPGEQHCTIVLDRRRVNYVLGLVFDDEVNLPLGMIRALSQVTGAEGINEGRIPTMD